jgi:hypothetical protein
MAGKPHRHGGTLDGRRFASTIESVRLKKKPETHQCIMLPARRRSYQCTKTAL